MESEIYLFDRPETGVLAIEVDDISGGHDLVMLKAVAESVAFGANS